MLYDIFITVLALLMFGLVLRWLFAVAMLPMCFLYMQYVKHYRPLQYGLLSRRERDVLYAVKRRYIPRRER